MLTLTLEGCDMILDCGNGCGDDLGTAMDRANPETVKGWLLLVVLWSWYALRCLATLRKPLPPNFTRTVFTPIHTGGVDHKYGNLRGGPQMFGGQADDGWSCALETAPPPIERLCYKMQNGRRVAVGWTLRRPKQYRYEPRTKRWTTTAVLAAYQDGSS